MNAREEFLEAYGATESDVLKDEDGAEYINYIEDYTDSEGGSVLSRRVLLPSELET